MRPLLLLLSILLLPFLLAAGTLGSSLVEIRWAGGTGNTTGHVATLRVKNASSSPVVIAAATYYIPSDLIYQSYVARIETEFFLAGDALAEVKLYGYCADVSKPPARAGKRLRPFDKWVLIVTDGEKNPAAYALLPANQRSSWATGKVPRAITFDLISSGIPSANWPGTSTSLLGTVAPDRQPVETAALLVAYVELLEKSATELQKRGELLTPFSPDPEKEYSSIVQHAYWLTLAKLTGVAYGREDFALKIRKLVPASSPEKNDALEVGIDQLWAAFTAVCTNASTL